MHLKSRSQCFCKVTKLFCLIRLLDFFLVMFQLNINACELVSKWPAQFWFAFLSSINNYGLQQWLTHPAALAACDELLQ